MSRLSRRFRRALPLVALGLAGVASRGVLPHAHAAGAHKPAVRARTGREVGRGDASYYGRGLYGRPTASGERFERGGLTAAHRTLPFGTRVRVENLRTGRSVVVRINDRGPFVHDRIIDLNEAAGSVIGLGAGGAGVAPVRISLL